MSYSVVNSNRKISDKLEVIQGVNQGGLLSADLHKVYSDDIFNTLDHFGTGSRIADICVAAPGCCYDVHVAVQSNNPSDLQILINGSKYYSGLHHYMLQPQKRVVVEPELTNQKEHTITNTWKIGEESMHIVKKASHIGIRM